jgi:hypothetical protein
LAREPGAGFAFCTRVPALLDTLGQERSSLSDLTDDESQWIFAAPVGGSG